MIRPKAPAMTARESKEGYSRVAERSFGLCEGCGKVQATQMHHRLHRSHGGDERVTNLLHMCLTCHQSAHLDSDRYVIGWAVRTGYDPADVWVVYRGNPVALTADGGLT
jgi:5-methylcytosine-specific restriction endonuclease McrA